MCGTFFTPTNNSPKNLPAYFSWLDAVSYVKYAYIGAALNENAGLELRCTQKELKFNSKGQPTCPVTHGSQVMADLGMQLYYTILFLVILVNLLLIVYCAFTAAFAISAFYIILFQACGERNPKIVKATTEL